jgi:uncharacterized protein (TIGR02996 family)
MSDQAALLAGIWEQPHDDVIRLVYADWLEENDQPERAEFIRLQCELARLDEWDDAERIAALKLREQELLASYERKWRVGWEKKYHRWPFRRGFVYPRHSILGGEKFLKLPPTALNAAPQWAGKIEKFARLFDQVFSSPLLLRFDDLEIQTAKTPIPFAKFAENELLRNLSALDVDEYTTVAHREDVASLTAFLNGTTTISLTRFDCYAHLGAESFAALVASRTAKQLTHLRLGGWRLDAVTGAPFARENFPHLRSLRVESQRVVQLLVSTPDTQLRKLDLKWCGLTDGDFEQLAAWPGLANIQWLDVDFNMCREAGYRALLNSPHASGLKHFAADVYYLRSIPEVLAALRERFGPALKL